MEREREGVCVRERERERGGEKRESGQGFSAMEFGVENVSLPKKDMRKNSQT